MYRTVSYRILPYLVLLYSDDDGDRDTSNYFADDNPLCHVTAKLERGGERRYEFSGPLGEKIKESLQENASAESPLDPAMHQHQHEYDEHRDSLRCSRRHFESLSLTEGVNPMARPRRESNPTFASSSSSAYMSATTPVPVPADKDKSRDRDRDSVSVSPLSTHLGPVSVCEPDKHTVAAKMVPKVNILKVPRRSIGSVTSLSLDDQTLHSYAKDDYANYAIGKALQHNRVTVSQ